MKIPRIIVSLTSFPAAIHLAPEAIRSVLRGTVKPDKVVLYLTASQFPHGVLPAEIEALKAEYPHFEVRFWQQNIRSYTKLIPALHDFPDDWIVTVDDDIRYPRRMIEQLLATHKKYPEAIIAHNIRHIRTDARGELRRYFDWKRYKPRRYLWTSLKPNYENLLFGAGGVLYPPRPFDPAMLDPELFLAMAPTVDDVWFWAAATAGGTKVAPVPFGYWNMEGLDKPREIALSTINTHSGVDVNQQAVRAILERFPLIKARFEERKRR